MKTIIKFGVVVVSTSALAFSSYIVGCKLKLMIQEKKKELLGEDATVVLDGSDLRSKALHETREESLKEDYEEAENVSESHIEASEDDLVLYSGNPEDLDTKKVKYTRYKEDPVEIETPTDTIVKEVDYSPEMEEMASKVTTNEEWITLTRLGHSIETLFELDPELFLPMASVEFDEIYSAERRREFNMLLDSEVWNAYREYIRTFVTDDLIYDRLYAMFSSPIAFSNPTSSDICLHENIIEDRYNIMGSAASKIEGYSIMLGEIIIHFAKLGNYDTDIPVVELVAELLVNIHEYIYNPGEVSEAISNHTFHGDHGYGIFGLPNDLGQGTGFREQYFQWIGDKL